MTEKLLEKFFTALNSLPGIGKKSAYRIGFHLIRMNEEEFQQFIDNLKSIKQSIQFCEVCGSLSESKICEICASDKRDVHSLCVVERAEDVLFVENTKEFSGKYHVLGGVISPIDGIGPDKLRIKELLQRLQKEPVEEIILATNPTLEGDATASYIANLLKDSKIKLTRIAHGISVGSTLEFADRYTLSQAIRSRNTL